MKELDELRQLTAGRLLEIWRNSAALAREPVERALLCNAQVLAESCFYQGEAVFPQKEDVLAALTVGEMETLLRQLMQDRPVRPAEENPLFDPKRFERLREG